MTTYTYSFFYCICSYLAALKNKSANSKCIEKFSQVDIFETRNTFKTTNYGFPQWVFRFGVVGRHIVGAISPQRQ